MLRITFAATALLLAGPAIRLCAQTATDPVALPTIEVTGTRLGRPLDASPTSASVLTRAEIERSGVARLGELLATLPEFPANYITDTVAINGTRGVQAMDLRGLGAGNTLVLVNGRRTTVSANVWDTTTFVDFNRFSPAFVERVEILKGGASAVYGADAVGGVINIITRRQPAGGEAALSYGNTFATDAAELNASAAVGAAQGRLGLSVGLDFFQRHAQAHVDRSFSRTANLVPRFAGAYDYYASLPPGELAGYDGRSLTAPNARVLLVGGQVNGQNGVAVPGLPAGAAITALPGTGGTSAGTLNVATPNFTAPYTAATNGQFTAAAAVGYVAPELTRGAPGARNLFDFNRYIWTVPEARRIAGNARLDYGFANGLALFAETAGGRNRSVTQFHPPGVSALVPRTNPFNPFGVDVTTVWRIPDAGPRRSVVNDGNFSGLAGLRGRAHSPIAWEVAAHYSRDEFRDTISNTYLASRVFAALTGASPATALNPFGGESYRQNATLLESLKTQSWFGGAADLLGFDAQASGTVLDLPGGPVRAAAYAEHRRERFSAVSDAASQAGDILGSGQSGGDVSWERSVLALAGEVRLPLLASAGGAPGSERLALEGAARMENFSGNFHSGFRPTAGLVACPTRELLMRASYAWTFRAPTLPQLFAPQSDGFFNSVPDPRRPVALTGDLNDGPNVSRLVRQGGNPGLSAETGRVRQTGAVWRPRAISGFALEATWFRYDLENIIAGVSPTYVLDNELGGLGALVHRAAGSQTFVNTTGSPIKVLTGPAGQTTSIAPGQSATVPGSLQRIDSFTVNLSRRRLVGWDFGTRYARQWSGTHCTFTAGATYLDQSSSAYDQQSPLVNNAGGNPRWRGRATLDGERGPWGAGLTMTYTASSGYHSADGGYQKPYRVVHLRASYTAGRNSWLRGTQFMIGLDDVFNESTPLYADPPMGFNYGTVSRPQGRFWRMTAKQSW